MLSNHLLFRPFRQFKANKSLKDIKEGTKRDLGEYNIIDVKELSRQNLRAIKQRLKQLSENEIALFKRLLDKEYILHHTTSNKIMDGILAGDKMLHDPTDLKRYGKAITTKHTPDGFCGIESNLFFGIGGTNSSIPYFTRHPHDAKSNTSCDYATIKVNLNKFKLIENDLYKNLWSSGHFHHFNNFMLADLDSPIFKLGKTYVTWRYHLESALAEKQMYVKHLIFFENNEKQPRMRLDLRDEIAIGNDLIPFMAFLLIERLRHVDSTILEYLVNNPEDEDSLNALFEIFFRVDEFEVHLPANLKLDDPYTDILTPQKRKEIAESVAEAAAKGDITTLEKLHAAKYPLDGYFYEDPFYFDNSTIDLPLVKAIQNKQYKTIKWLIDHGANRACFKTRDKYPIININIMDNIIVAVLLITAADTHDLDLVKFLIEECYLDINLYIETPPALMFDKPNLLMEMKQAEDFVATFNNRTIFKSHNINDMSFRSLLKCKNINPTIFDYIKSKLSYCNLPDFNARQLFDIAKFGNGNFCELLLSLPEYEKNQHELIEVAKENHNYDALFFMIKDNPEKCKQALMSCNKDKINFDFLNKVIKALGYNNKPQELRQLLTDEWIYDILDYFKPDPSRKHLDLVELVDWLIKTLEISPSEMFKKPKWQGFNYKNIVSFYCHNQCYTEAQKLIEAGAPAFYPELIEYSFSCINDNPLNSALYHGNLSFVKYLIKDRNIKLPLHDMISLVIMSGSVELMEFILSEFQLNESDVNTKDRNLVAIALSYNQLEMADMLFKCGYKTLNESDHSIEEVIYRLSHGVINPISVETLKWIDKANIVDPSSLKWENFQKNLKKPLSSNLILMQWLYPYFKDNIDAILIEYFAEYPLETIQFCENQHIAISTLLKNNDSILLKGLLTYSTYNFYLIQELFKSLNKYYPEYRNILKTTKDSDGTSILYKILQNLLQSVDSTNHYNLKGLLEIGLSQTELDLLLFSAFQTKTQHWYNNHPPRPEDISLLLQHGADPFAKITHKGECITIYQWVATNQPDLMNLFPLHSKNFKMRLEQSENSNIDKPIIHLAMNR